MSTDEDVRAVPFMGHLTGETIRQMLQQRFAQDYFMIAHALAPAPMFRHAALSSAIACVREEERRRGL